MRGSSLNHLASVHNHQAAVQDRLASLCIRLAMNIAHHIKISPYLFNIWRYTYTIVGINFCIHNRAFRNSTIATMA